jgi:hypothetical protein
VAHDKVEIRESEDLHSPTRLDTSHPKPFGLFTACVAFGSLKVSKMNVPEYHRDVYLNDTQECLENSTVRGSIIKKSNGRYRLDSLLKKLPERIPDF